MERASSEQKKPSPWAKLLESGFVAALCIFLILTRADSHRTWFDIALVVGAVGFSIAALITLLSVAFSWPEWKTELVKERTFLWLVMVPIGIGIAVWLGLPVWRWFNTIPSWAAVIIVLLFLIYINMPKRQ